MHSSGFSQGKITPGTSSFSFGHFNPAETFHSTYPLTAMFVYIRVPPNNSINARVPSLGPSLSLFSEVSYVTISGNLSEGYPFSSKLLPRDHHVGVLRQAAFQN